MVKNITKITKILGKHLKRLSKDGLGAFMKELCDLEPPRGITQMQLKLLEGKTPVEIAEIIMKFYTIRHGPGKVIQALKASNENQVRMDLQKELRADGVKKIEMKAQMKKDDAPGTSVGQASAGGQNLNAGASQQPAGDIKPKRARKPKTAPGTSVGQASAGGQNLNAGASQQPAGDIKPKRGRQPKTAPGTSVGQASAGGQNLNVGTSQQPAGDIKPKRGRKPKTAPGTSVGQASAGGQNLDVGASQQPAGDIKPKRGRKSKTDDKEHFVTENRINLINLIVYIDPVLDELLDKKLLTQEQYDTIRKKSTSQDKMRELYDFVRSWGNEVKDTFLDVLKKHNPVTIKSLLKK